MKSEDIKRILKENGIKQWQLAKAAGIGESTLVCWLRDEEQTGDREKRIICALDMLLGTQM